MQTDEQQISQLIDERDYAQDLLDKFVDVLGGSPVFGAAKERGMSKEYTLGHHEGRPAMFNFRGLVCVFEAGYQQTREQDAKKVCAAMNAAPELYAACERMLPWIGKMIADGGHLGCVAPNDAVGAMLQAEEALSRARGV